MKSRFLIFFLFVMVTLTACANDKGNENKLSLDDSTKGKKLDDQNVLKEPLIDSKAEVIEGDFVYRLVSEKSVYAEGGKVEVYAELEYVGDKPEIKIVHAASPFSFPMREKTRGYDLLYMMDQPLIVTLLKKGEPLRESFKGAGSYGSEDPKDYIDFMISVAEASQKGTLPWGDYQVFGFANFEPIYKESQENETLRLKAEIEFIVEKPEKNG